ncbi:hypothetical protein [Rhizobium sp. L43]|uniref:hypothetical protein n=1 Tax=Rhizobium sp. L43 TaxID=2035452 RepID=UPI000BE8F728|nr:hypothetical protein [Rhizobium sp. L43]PDS77905.1 hypothetical protein CO667_14645 [Rhizobium sp. L43]
MGFARAGDLLAILLGLFAVAVVMEQAMTALFQWRVYRRYFDTQALKTPLMFLVGLGVVLSFKYDVFKDVLTLVSPEQGAPNETISRLLSALVLAGGSAGVYNLLVRLGFRSPPAPLASIPALDETEAWISVTVNTTEPVAAVCIAEKIDDASYQPAKLLGVLKQSKLRGVAGFNMILGVFLANPMRYPNYGGRKVKANIDYRITVRTATSEVTVFEGRLASRAIIDFVVTVPEPSEALKSGEAPASDEVLPAAGQ